ncbi:glycoside hydrolase family 71 protein [Aspergillus stella-maris]|uniref:glycoside hydrolase family 71 protein n=1 Tax=Aspergillus stella-maris TaxID=1810926 RepID=UPI003CCE34D5
MMFSSKSWALPILAILSLSASVNAKAVFAHFMIGNTENYTSTDWTNDITLAKASSIDAFALNAGFGAKYNARSFRAAFDHAAALDFKVFFSLDYSGSGRWPKDQVIDLLSNFTDHEAYFRHSDGRALISTFEGYQAANEWGEIKRDVAKAVGKENCCVFIPDWTSVGPHKASSVSAIDGLMSWEAWPYGNQEMNTTKDQEYMDLLDGKPFIMPVSPWFYTNLRQFNKNWVWRGDDLWYSRWEEVIELQPEYVEILTWNDYGESHYIGPVRHNATGVIAEGAPLDYVDGMPHDGWRDVLPFVIQRYKKGKNSVPEIEEENLSVWYRLSPGNACGTGKTTGNSPSSDQTLMKPADVLEDKVFYSALLDSNADVRVSIGGQNRSAEWTGRPDGGKGVYHGSVPFGDRTGEVVVTLSRDGEFLAQMKGRSIEDSCPGNLTNWNAWVGNVTAVKSSRGNGDGDGDGDEDSAAVSMEMVPTLWILALAIFVFF